MIDETKKLLANFLAGNSRNCARDCPIILTRFLGYSFIVQLPLCLLGRVLPTNELWGILTWQFYCLTLHRFNPLCMSWVVEDHVNDQFEHH